MPEPSPAPARVLIVDDHPAVREALALRIGREPGLEVCGEADDVAEALRLAAEARPAVAVVDLSLKTSDGLELIKRIRDRDRAIRIVVWSMHPESLYAERALRAGALAYVSKDEATDTIIEAIGRVLRGEVWLSEAMAQRLLLRSFGRQAPRSPLDALADRELEVFRRIGRGTRTAEIARQMHLSVSTVETYRNRIRQKLGLADGTALARYAIRWVLENE